MKKLLILALTFLSFAAVAQKPDSTKAVKPDTVVLEITEWQEQQMKAYETQELVIAEAKKLLLAAILDMNGKTEANLRGKQVRTVKVTNTVMRKGKIKE